MRIRLTMALVMALLVLSLAWTSGSQEPADTGGEITTVRLMWSNMVPEELESWETYLIDPFEAENPDVDIQLEPTPDVEAVLKVQLASGAGPDLFMLDASNVKQFVDAGRVRPLDDIVDEYDWDDLIFDWALAVSSVDGTVYAIPHAYEASMIFANQDILDEYGWKLPQNREEFVAVMDAALEAGLTPIALGTAGLSLINQFPISHYLSTYAGPGNVKALFEGNASFTDPVIRQSFEMLDRDWKAGYWMNRRSAEISHDEARSMFFSGQSVFNAEGTWIIKRLVPADVQFEVSVAPWPSMREGVAPTSAIATGAVISFNSNASDAVVDAGARFIDFMYRNEELLAEAIAYGGMETLSREIDPGLYPQDMDKNVRKVLSALESVPRGEGEFSYTPWSFYPTRTNEYLYDNIDKVFYDRLSLDDYLERAQEILDQEIEEGFVFAGP